MDAKKLIKAFNELPEGEQRSFLETVLSYPPDPIQGMSKKEWKAELDRRVLAYEKGETDAFKAEEVEKQLEKKYAVQFRPTS